MLIADDEPNQLELLSYNLSQSDFEVIRANDGEQALEMIHDHCPDLVILDWMMGRRSEGRGETGDSRGCISYLHAEQQSK